MVVTEGCSESRMRSRTSRGAPEWSGGKDLYIGKWYLGSRKVSGISGSVPGVTNGFRGSTGWGPPTPGGHMGPRGGAPAPNGLGNRPHKGPYAQEGKKVEIGRNRIPS